MGGTSPPLSPLLLWWTVEIAVVGLCEVVVVGL